MPKTACEARFGELKKAAQNAAFFFAPARPARVGSARSGSEPAPAEEVEQPIAHLVAQPDQLAEQRVEPLRPRQRRADLPRREAVALATSGDIVDAKSILALLWLERLRTAVA